MAIKLGTNNIVLPYSKAYLGTNLVYQKAPTEIYFNTCPFPASWTKDGNTKGTATNELGNWTIKSSSVSSIQASSYSIDRAFDRDTGTSWRNGNTAAMQVNIQCPVLIRPLKIYLRYANLSNSTSEQNVNELQGFNIITQSWETLYTLSKGSGTSEANREISTENYYSEFQIIGRNYSTSSPASVSEFQITEGYIKNE